MQSGPEELERDGDLPSSDGAGVETVPVVTPAATAPVRTTACSRAHAKAERARDKRLRAPSNPRPRMPHVARPFLSARHPVHVVMKLTPEVGRLRRHRAYHVFKWALIKCLWRRDFRVVHISIQAHHVHLLCEADDRLALARGIRGLAISAAQRLNTAISDELGIPRRRGRVFIDRYRATAIKTCAKIRSALADVLNDWRHHREDLAGMAQRRARIDPYSSAIVFPGWRGISAFSWPRYQLLPVSRPRTWLLIRGWKPSGPISVHDRP